ncbi:vWA domain-containing protein [Kroppenstedtia sanguinis]|uniref:VWA domain-containing protein n=1 Tax=Kroppenstedtia sanguinis TaxID=1380684 RepID=A0ABW4CBX8_9BACL
MLAEDFSSVINKLKKIDTSYNINSKKPGTEVDQPTLDQYNISILLDASGSMAGQVSGGRKMDVAKEAVETFVSTFPEDAYVSLVVYGHKGSNHQEDKQLSCSEIDEIYPLGTYEKAKFSDALKSVDATGWTPLADAIQKSGKTLKSSGDGKSKNLVYIVSDGLETCGGDPAKEAKALQKDGVSATVNIIGFDVDSTEQQALKEVAEAGGGTFTSANSKSDLESYFKREYEGLIGEWLRYGMNVEIDAITQSTQKLRELWKIRDQFVEMENREQSNIRKAVDFLENKEKDQGIGIDTNNRYSEIHDYFWDIFSDLESKINNDSEEIIDETKGDAQSKMDELERKKGKDTEND